MRVYLLCRGALVERDKAVEKIRAGSIIVVAASVVGEVVAQW